MRKISLNALSACLALLLAGSAYASDGDIGVMKVVKGDVRIERANETLVPKVGDRLKEHDRIVTGKDGSAGITMNDDTLLSTGPNSTLALNQFSFDPVTREGGLDASILKGALRYVSGLISKTSPRTVAINTRVATIGIRGTEFIVEVPDDEK